MDTIGGHINDDTDTLVGQATDDLVNRYKDIKGSIKVSQHFKHSAQCVATC